MFNNASVHSMKYFRNVNGTLEQRIIKIQNITSKFIKWYSSDHLYASDLYKNLLVLLKQANLKLCVL